MLKYHYQTELGVAFYNKKIYYFFIHLSHTHTMRKVLAMRFRWCRVYPTLMGIKVAFVVIDMVVGSRLAMIISVCLGSHFLRFSCCVFLFFFLFSFFFSRVFSPLAATVHVRYMNSSHNFWPVFREQCIHALFTDSQISFFINFFIKNGSYDTIHTFKNYFTIVFSVFSFQFQQNKFYSNRP